MNKISKTIIFCEAILFILFLFTNCKIHKPIQSLKSEVDSVELSAAMNMDLNEIPYIERRKYKLDIKRIDSLQNDISNSKLVKTESLFIPIFEIRFYRHEGTTLSYITDGNYYIVNDSNEVYHSKINLITKYWGITEENFLRLK